MFLVWFYLVFIPGVKYSDLLFSKHSLLVCFNAKSCIYNLQLFTYYSGAFENRYIQNNMLL